MMENEELKKEALPDAEETDTLKDTKPDEEILIPIKFNKEIRNLTMGEASELAQKGLKYDAVRENYEALRALATEKGKSVAAFLEDLRLENQNSLLLKMTEKCGGDEEMAKHILELEGKFKPDDNGFGELKTFFPDIISAEQLPAAVIEAATLSGRGLLDEYLRYLHKEKVAANEAKKQQRLAEIKSIGSQVSKGNPQSFETAEFLRGLWN